MQGLSMVIGPEQCLPLLSGSGLVQVRILVTNPEPQPAGALLQMSLHCSQLDQEPCTNNHFIKIETVIPFTK